MMSNTSRNARDTSLARMAPLALAAVCGLAAPAAPAAAQLSEPFPAVFELSGLTAAGGGDGSLGFVVGPTAGHSVASAGDVNGDGVADVVIGWAGDSAAAVVFGRAASPFPAAIDPATLDGTDGFRLIGAGSAGFSVDSAGDVNADGVDDIIIGAPSAGGGAYVVFGRAAGFPAEVDLATLGGANGFKLTGGSDTGHSVASAGDINGDDADDLIIGVTGWGLGFSDGAAYVVFGRHTPVPASISLSGLDISEGFKLYGSPRYGRLGAAVAAAGDVNGDGLDDIIVGAPGMYHDYYHYYAPGCGCSDPGNAYVIFGRETFTAPVDLFRLNGADGFRFAGFDQSMAGTSVSSAGDFNGDGVDDIIIGGPAAFGGVDEAFLVFGRDTTTGTAFHHTINPFSLDGENGLRLKGAFASAAGASVAGAGDVNGDGIDDVIVGAPYQLPGGEFEGSYVVFGNQMPWPATISLPALDGTDGFLLNGAGGGWVLFDNGEGVAAAGDVNGDGIADLILADPEFTLPATYIVFGRMPDAPCFADCDGSGELDFFDFLCFQNQFAAGDPQADCDESGELDFFDFLCFQNAFAAGCS